ncbi:unnamed protein product [Chironomus riparius]|uniref:F-box domain-containing protein n=1 Tax=Chironomus riparius TaxID=315576 RepID=A0A9N9S453_9DIPT|nr:unnamed protein product [Chironomus riparius]
MNLSEDALIQIFHQLDSISISNFILSSKFAFHVFCNSSELLRRYELKITSRNFKQISESVIFENVKFRNILISVKSTTEFKDLVSDNIFKIFTNQESIEKITVSNHDWTWNGIPHDVFNEICKNCKNLDHLVLEGAGTGSYFDNDEFPFKITKLGTSMITFHWYVGIRSPRVYFLESQKGYLKELTIHQLPYDFDGGKVLKYIIEEMNLDKFNYGEIPLIQNGQKQAIKEFEASEIQITSAYEIVTHFTCDKFILKLSNTDISSDSIEKIINPSTNIFDNIKEFEVIDNSSNRGIFGVFLGLFRNLKNILKLTFRTQDKNINTIFECLKIMSNLEVINLTSTAPRALQRYQTILKKAPKLKKIYIAKQTVEDAINAFKNSQIEIFDIENSQCLWDFTSKSKLLCTSDGYNQMKIQETKFLTGVCFKGQTLW